MDIRRAIAAGRRRRTRRAAGYAGVATVTALAVAGVAVAVAVAGGVFDAAPPPTAATGTPRTAAPAPPKAEYTIPGIAGWSAPTATPPTSCRLERLPAPALAPHPPEPGNAPMALVSGADPTGRYIVGHTYPKGGSYQAVIWHNGKGEKVMLPGDLEESLQDVNSTGTAVGWSYVGDSEADTGPVPYVYHDGKVAKLPGVRRGSAYAINEAGAVMGDDNAQAALVWPSATAQPIRLPVPAGTSEATASDIDEDGTTVGAVGAVGTVDNARPYVWFSDGTHRVLPMPSLGGAQAATARVFSIRNGWATGVATNLLREAGVDPKPRTIAGQSDDATGTIQAVVWRCQ
ncbi:hypothetical protein [Plantactinospora sp. KLBMP9567]|uniref:hypothetical protein n=1 Tax=Plantactinospora sp. KLBMP9567 TaxID=3085900 RepID=UPI002980E62D|nr:hypothetical protein [Plantactinospora sp. KLBMP9567]MDW5328371.1 hypothetical protein [Plantactinospora sp. KLBMP9567]